MRQIVSPSTVLKAGCEFCCCSLVMLSSGIALLVYALDSGVKGYSCDFDGDSLLQMYSMLLVSLLPCLLFVLLLYICTDANSKLDRLASATVGCGLSVGLIYMVLLSSISVSRSSHCDAAIFDRVVFFTMLAATLALYIALHTLPIIVGERVRLPQSVTSSLFAFLCAAWLMYIGIRYGSSQCEVNAASMLLSFGVVSAVMPSLLTLSSLLLCVLPSRQNPELYYQRVMVITAFGHGAVFLALLILTILATPMYDPVARCDAMLSLWLRVVIIFEWVMIGLMACVVCCAMTVLQNALLPYWNESWQSASQQQRQQQQRQQQQQRESLGSLAQGEPSHDPGETDRLIEHA